MRIKRIRKFMYNISNASRILFKNKFISTTMILSMLIGLFFPISLISIGVNYYEKVDMLGKGADRLYLMASGERILSNDEISKKYEAIEYLSIESSRSDGILVGDKFNLVTIMAVDVNYSRQFKRFVDEGRKFTHEDFKNDKKVCLIGELLLENKNIGTIVGIGQDEYRVVGILRNEKFSDKVVIPFNGKVIGSIAYTFLFKEEYSKSECLDILQEIKEENDGASIARMKDVMKRENKNMKIMLRALSAIGLIVFLYSSVNISTVLMNKIDLDKKNNAIKLAMGAKKSSIYGELVHQLNFLTISAIAFDSLLIYGLSTFINGFKINIYIVLSITIINILWNVVLAFGLTKRNLKSEIIENLKGRQ